MKKHPIYIIVATDKNNGIGKNGKMPWHFKKELKYFANITRKTKDLSKQNMVIMGRTTWESLPEKFKPLPDRKNVILSRNSKISAKVEIANSFKNAINIADENIEKIFIIGGATVYEQAINLPNLDGIYITKIQKIYDCDTFFPKIPSRFSEKIILGKEQENNINFEFLFLKKNS